MVGSLQDARYQDAEVERENEMIVHAPPPTVQILNPEPGPVQDDEIPVTLLATTEAHSILSVELHVNGDLCMSRPEIETVKNGRRMSLNARLQPGENTLAATTVTTAGVHSEPAVIKVTYQPE